MEIPQTSKWLPGPKTIYQIGVWNGDLTVYRLSRSQNGLLNSLHGEYSLLSTNKCRGSFFYKRLASLVRIVAVEHQADSCRFVG